MGKKLIIKGADFSANAIHDVTMSLMPILDFYANKAYQGGGSGFSPNPPTLTNAKRCAAFCNFASVASGYNKISMQIKTGYQFVFGIGVGTTGNYYKGDGVETEFTWAEDTSYVEVPLNGRTILNINLRKSDDSNMSNTTVASDIIDYIMLEE